ncbi:MAG: hypothetical protein IPN71_08885 [Fibrobacteres bacterium]|nr:hypothetical protein [Fibrobacterota bacterium]
MRRAPSHGLARCTATGASTSTGLVQAYRDILGPQPASTMWLAVWTISSPSFFKLPAMTAHAESDEQEAELVSGGCGRSQ